MQYELVQDASTWLIIFIAIAGVTVFVQLFIHAYWTRYRHQRSLKQQPCNEVLPQQSNRELQIVKPEPKQLDHDKLHQTPLNVVFDLEAKRRPFWYSIG